ncbi:MAG: chromate transporter [Eubacterium sp.]|nr:chromate transporter [Eubacterium sp.]
MIYLILFWTFFKIGAFTFGGGYAMLPLIEQEVASHGWMSMKELINFIAVSESTPGPFAVNCSTYVGRIVAGPFGAFCATLGVVLPSFLIILLVARVFAAFKKSKAIAGLMSGLKPAVVGMIGAAIVTTGTAVFFPEGIHANVLCGAAFWVSLAIFLLSLYLAEKKKLHPILVIVIAAGIGIISSFFLPVA